MASNDINIDHTSWSENGSEAVPDSPTTLAPVKGAKVVSYNLHGYGQGCVLLNMLCDKYGMFSDVIYIQEH